MSCWGGTSKPGYIQIDHKETHLRSIRLFPPIFETTDGQLVQAAPTVQPISLQLSKPEQLGYQIDELEHVEETDSLFYTHKEVQAYMELFHAKRSSKAVTYALTSQYCAIPGSCSE